MSGTAVSFFDKIKTRMKWDYERHNILSSNVANADVPNYKPLDLDPSPFGGSGPKFPPISLKATHMLHFPLERSQNIAFQDPNHITTLSSEHSVSLEEEMMKISTNQLDYQAVTGLYQRSLALIRMAINGKG